MKDTTPQAVQAAHELLLWLIPQIDKFPRVRRFTLGERLESAMLEVLELSVEAAYTHNKRAALQRATAYAEPSPLHLKSRIKMSMRISSHSKRDSNRQSGFVCRTREQE
jgi:hypothetical protein